MIKPKVDALVLQSLTNMESIIIIKINIIALQFIICITNTCRVAISQDRKYQDIATIKELSLIKYRKQLKLKAWARSTKKLRTFWIRYKMNRKEKIITAKNLELIYLAIISVFLANCPNFKHKVQLSVDKYHPYRPLIDLIHIRELLNNKNIPIIFINLSSLHLFVVTIELLSNKEIFSKEDQINTPICLQLKLKRIIKALWLIQYNLKSRLKD